MTYGSAALAFFLHHGYFETDEAVNVLALVAERADGASKSKRPRQDIIDSVTFQVKEIFVNLPKGSGKELLANSSSTRLISADWQEFYPWFVSSEEM